MKHAFALGASLCLFAGCVTSVPAPAAVTSFEPQTACSAQVSLVNVATLTPEKPSGHMEQLASLGPAGPCAQTASGASVPYAVFSLPTSGKVASISAGAMLEEARLIAPTVFTLSADGRVIRTFSDRELRHRDRTLGVLFIPRTEEKFVAVAVEPGKIGGAFSFVAVDPTTVQTPAGLTTPEQIAQFKASLARPYSYEGQVYARAYFADPAPATP
ncbi:MAG TPA: hypothetical protein PLN33_11295 [Hyphomonadaceae bacterium]|nr:hypothetical protein [Hyphomonadaceae bacterium]HPN05431.1 hypothetical protein [Hyphomonadaceae bacterium]